jgi:hypothetical protein
MITHPNTITNRTARMIVRIILLTLIPIDVCAPSDPDSFSGLLQG